MIKESRYILRRILIGVGIILVFSFIRGNKVKAVNIDSIQYVDPILKKEVNMFVDLDINPYYCYKIDYLDNSTRFQFELYSSSSPMKWYSATNTHNGFSGSNVSHQWYNSWNNSSGSNVQNYGPSGSNFNLFSKISLQNAIENNVSNNVFLLYCNYISLELNSNEPLNLEDYIIGNGNNVSSKIISLNPIKLNSENGVIITYLFSPEFSNFNTNNFIYQYKFGNGTTWLNLTENEQVFRVNNNGTIYVRVKNKNTNEVVDNQTFTITDIGTFAIEQDYDITFSGEYRTENYLNNNISSKTQSIIKEYQIYIDYLPKASILKYQYQYVNEGNSLDSNNWSNVSSSDNGSITYVASQNGTLYARILDSSDNVLFSNKFTVDSIGSLAFDSNQKGVKNFYSSLSNKIGFSGPISELINIPLQLINTISTGLSGGLTCSDYPLGSLFGTNLVIPCVNIKKHLGNSLYTTIDLIIACVMIYYIIKMFSDLYTNLLFIQKNPIQDLGRRGD